jgi:restriction endonuclease S subunit
MTSFPNEWKIESLDSLINRGVIKLNRGDIISKRDIAAHPGDYPIFSSAKENNGLFGRYGKYMFDEEVITWSIDGGGRLFYREKQKFSVTNVGGILRIIDKSVFDYKFLFYALTNLHSQVIFDWSRKAHPSVIRLVYDKVPIPPLDEQHKIVELLEDHLSRLDAALADVKQVKIKAAQFRRSLLQAAFNGYFSDESFMLGTEIPPSWRKISLGKVLQTRKQKDIPSSFPGLPYIGMEHVVRDIGLIDSFGSSSDYRSSAPRVYEGDVLYGRLRPYLNKVVISPCEAFASGEFIVLPPNNEIMGKFLQLRLLCQDFVEFAGTLDTGDRPRVSWEQISQFELALPPIDEQIKMISILEDHLSRLDVVVKLADAMEKQSFTLRRSLLQTAFTGQLTNEVVSV